MKASLGFLALALALLTPRASVELAPWLFVASILALVCALWADRLREGPQ
jgi:hypothetical protein